MTPKLAIFDCDGVLVDSEGPVNILLVDDLAAHGLTVAPADVASLFTGGTMEGVFATARSMGADLPDDWVGRFYLKMFALLDRGVPLIPGVLDLIDRLEASGSTIWIASNGPMEKMRRTLGPSGLWDRMEGRILSREHHAPKPDPAMIRYAMAQSDVPREDTVFIDDSPTGCNAGLAAGVRTFGFVPDGQEEKLSAIGVEVVHSMAELQSRLIPTRSKVRNA